MSGPIDVNALVGQALTGATCVVTRREHDWDFAFGSEAGVAVPTPWRVVGPECIELCDSDDEQWFGLSAPVDAEARANALLAGAVAGTVRLDPVTADLTVWFSNGLRLEVFNNSTGYEGWQVTVTANGLGVAVIAMGGGGFSIF